MKHKATVIGKRIMTVMLSLVMVAGVFAGMKLDVRAEGTTWNVEDLEIGDRIYAGDKIHIPDDVSYLDIYTIILCRGTMFLLLIAVCMY